MENIRRKIRVFFVTYGDLLLAIIMVIATLIYVPRKLNQMVIDKGVVSNTNSQEQIDLKEKEKDDKVYIEKFIEYCNLNKIEEAYDMVSTICKEEKYKDIYEFKEEFINTIFSKEIYEYSIYKSNEGYIVQMKQNPLEVGRIDLSEDIKIKIIEEIFSKKIYIYE